jgi:hypothetical protein
METMMARNRITIPLRTPAQAVRVRGVALPAAIGIDRHFGIANRLLAEISAVAGV